jgi:phosphohistidine phosphatase
VLSSPCARARDTANIVVRKMKIKTPVVLTKYLMPKASSVALIGMIQKKYGKHKSLLLVGHEPFLSSLISHLLGGYSELSIDLKKGGLCKLLIDRLTHGRCATLEWLLTPGQLMKMR